MLPAPPTDSDIESLVVDALERLPEPFRGQLGSVAIVIEDEASPAQLASVGAQGLFGLYQGIPRTRLAADQRQTPSKITIYPRAARPRLSDPARPGRGGRRHRVPRDRPPLRDQGRASPGAEGGRSLRQPVRARRVSGRGAPSTTGAIRSTQVAYCAPLGCRPSSATSRRSVGGAERQVEDVDERDPPRRGEPGP